MPECFLFITKTWAFCSRYRYKGTIDIRIGSSNVTFYLQCLKLIIYLVPKQLTPLELLLANRGSIYLKYHIILGYHFYYCSSRNGNSEVAVVVHWYVAWYCGMRREISQEDNVSIVSSIVAKFFAFYLLIKSKYFSYCHLSV